MSELPTDPSILEEAAKSAAQKKQAIISTRSEGTETDLSNEAITEEDLVQDNKVVIPNQYKNLPSGMVDKMYVDPTHLDPAKNQELAERRAKIIKASQREEQARITTNTTELMDKYVALSEEQKQKFVEIQQRAIQLVARAITGKAEMPDLTADEEWILDKARGVYEKQKEQNPDAPLTISFSSQTDQSVYSNLVNRLTFPLLIEQSDLDKQTRANEIRRSVGAPELTVGDNQDTTETGRPNQETVKSPKSDGEKSVVDPEAKNRTEQQRLGLAASLLTNYFDGKSNLAKLLTNSEIMQLEPLRIIYNQQRAQGAPLTVSLSSLSPEIRKLIIEDLPALFMQGDVSVAERARQQREAIAGEPNAVIQSPETPKQEARATGKVEWEAVNRSTEVVAIGDLFGSAEALRGNLEAANAATVGPDGKLVWTGADKKVVFMGDIAGDRQMHGLEDLVQISELNAQAEQSGGSIDVLVGNHDDFLVSFLMDTDGGGQADCWLSCKQSGYNGLLELCRFGSDTLKNDFDNFQRLDSSKQEQVWQRLKVEREQILQNMRTDSEGQKILNALCDMKIATIKDDSLFCHTDPTLAMMRSLLINGADKFGLTVDRINEIYQNSLREYLVEGRPVSQPLELSYIKDVFVDTNNRADFWKSDEIRNDQHAIDSMVSQIRQSGVNGIIHGHSPDYPRSIFAPKDLLIETVDLGAFKDQSAPADERSVLSVGKTGEIRKGGNSRVVRQ